MVLGLLRDPQSLQMFEMMNTIQGSKTDKIVEKRSKERQRWQKRSGVPTADAGKAERLAGLQSIVILDGVVVVRHPK